MRGKHKGISPTQRSLKYLRDRGYFAEKVEQRLPIPGRFVTRDLFDFIDVIAIRPGSKETVGIQITSASNVSSHLKKIKEHPVYYHWAQYPRVLEVHGWKGSKLRLITTRPPNEQRAALEDDARWIKIVVEQRKIAAKYCEKPFKRKTPVKGSWIQPTL